MNSARRKILKQSESRFLSEVGIGQFTWFRFADWLREEEPDLAAEILADAIRNALMQSDDLVEGQRHVNACPECDSTVWTPVSEIVTADKEMEVVCDLCGCCFTIFQDDPDSRDR